jgi:signal transduction histidine kinase
MTDTLFPSDEVERLRAVIRYDILDTPPEETYDRITRLAARIFQVPAVVIGILDDDRIWFKSRYGLELNEVPRNTGPLAAALLQKEPFFIDVDDASGTPALALPANGGEYGKAKFYAGMPLTTPEGFILGALLLLDTKPRAFDNKEIASLQDLAALVLEQLKMRLAAVANKSKLEDIKSSGDNVGFAHKEFAATLVHELRSPLNSILGFAQLLERDNSSPSQLAKIKQILHAGWHQAKLIEDFYDLAVKKSEQDSLRLESLPLFDVVDECYAMMKPQAQMKSIHLRLLRNEDYPAVYADRTKLKQVLINLLSNAIKYTPVGGNATIQWENNFPNRVRVSIVDTGIGIAAEKMDELFEPYNRLGQEDGPEEGMGIGLTVTKKLVEMMGGTIGVTSSEDAGSTFWIELPATEAAGLLRGAAYP